MRKRLPRTSTRKTTLPTLKPAPIITFDSPDDNHHIFDPSFPKAVSSKKLKEHLEILKQSAAAASTVCLTSNQVNLPVMALALCEPRVEDKKVQWISEQGYTQSQDFVVYHKPYIKTAKELVQSSEESVSFPFILFTANRYNSLTFTYQANGQKNESTLEGYKAWVFQQAYQQLEGSTALDWRVNHGRMGFKPQMVKYFSKSSAIIEEYSKDLKTLFKEYPQLIEQPKQVTDWSQTHVRIQQEVLSFEGDYIQRIIKHYHKDMNRLMQIIEMGTLNKELPKADSNDIKITYLK